MLRIPSGYFEIRKRNSNLELWFNDKSEACCGENRDDWTYLGKVSKKILKKFGSGVLNKEINGITGQERLL